MKPRAEAPLPIDFLITRPNASRASISLKTLTIRADGKPIGSVTATEVPITFAPVGFGRGFARLGIMETKVGAGARTGTAQIIASLTGGTRCVIHLLAEEP
jgi:hypothetical protein